MSAPADPPQVSQWLTVEATHAVVERGEDPATLVDWAGAGYPDANTFRLWSRNSCGVACLRSWLTWRGHALPDTWTMTRELVQAGGYQWTGGSGPEDRIRGLLHAPAVAWLAGRWGEPARLVSPIALDEVAEYVRRPGAGAIISVSPDIRWPARPARTRGGHLVLAFGVQDDPEPALVLNNPSGLSAAHGADPESAQSAVVPFSAIESRRAPHAVLLG